MRAERFGIAGFGKTPRQHRWQRMRAMAHTSKREGIDMHAMSVRALFIGVLLGDWVGGWQQRAESEKASEILCVFVSSSSYHRVLEFKSLVTK